MKTLTIRVSDEAAKGLEQAGPGRTPEETVAQMVEAAFVPADWGDLSAADIAAIEDGLADFASGATIPHDQIVAEIRAKYE